MRKFDPINVYHKPSGEAPKFRHWDLDDLASDTLQRASATASNMKDARDAGRPVVAVLGSLVGGHNVVAGGSGAILASMVLDGWFSHVVCDVSTAMADYEAAIHGNLWPDPIVRAPEINGCFNLNEYVPMGLGEAIGSSIDSVSWDRGRSIAAACFRASTPFTIHPQLGSDPTVMCENFRPDLFGRRAYHDLRLLMDCLVDCVDYGSGLLVFIGHPGLLREVVRTGIKVAQNVAGRSEPPDIGIVAEDHSIADAHLIADLVRSLG